MASANKIVVAHFRPRWLLQTETWLYAQVRHLPEQIESHVICGRTENLDQFAVPNIHSLAGDYSLAGLTDKVLRKLRWRSRNDSFARVARRVGATVAHSHFGSHAWGNLSIVRRARMNHVVSFYGADATVAPRRYPIWRERYRELFAEVDCVLCEGPHLAKSICELGCPPEKIRVHHLGADLERLRFIPREWDSSEELRVLIAGSFREKKGIPYALKALAELGRHVPVQVTVVGDASQDAESQEQKQQILGIIREHDMEKYVRLLGFQPYEALLHEAYRHHVFLSPSVTAASGDAEGGAPVSIIEMLATGMPVVSTTHCDIPNVVPAEGHHLLAEERDVQGLVERLTWLVEHCEQWSALAKAGRHRIQQHFDSRAQGERLARIYAELNGNGHLSNGQGSGGFLIRPLRESA